MRAFRSDRAGNEVDDGEFVAVALETQAEKRSLRKVGDLPEGPLVVVFEQSGRLRRFPGFGQFQPNADESAYLAIARQFALDFVNPPPPPPAPPAPVAPPVTDPDEDI